MDPAVMIALTNQLVPLAAVLITIGLPCVLLFVWLMQRSRGRQMGAGDAAAVVALGDIARRLETRIDALERMLDVDAPGWRARTR